MSFNETKGTDSECVESKVFDSKYSLTFTAAWFGFCLNFVRLDMAQLNPIIWFEWWADTLTGRN